MAGLIEIGEGAFFHCVALIELEFDKLEIIGDGFTVYWGAFAGCKLRSINLPSIKTVGAYAFADCPALTEAVFGEELEGIFRNAFHNCTALRRIVIPLKDNLTIGNNAFYKCENLSRVDTLDGEIHKTISSLHLESWRNEMEDEIDRRIAVTTYLDMVLTSSGTL